MANPRSNRQQLRDATQRQHARAENSWTRDGRFETLGDYCGWLEALWSVHHTLGQAAVKTSGEHMAAQAEQARVDALCLDLGRPVPDAPFDRSARSDSWALGVQYALNGSAIGAATLLKSNVIPPDWPTQYLQTMRDYARSGQLARFFVQLDQATLHLPDATIGAAAVFDAITREKCIALP